MLRITVELIPHGNEKEKRVISQATIRNTGDHPNGQSSSGVRDGYGNYVGEFFVDNLDLSVYVKNFARHRDVWALIKECLNALDKKYPTILK